MTSRLNLPYAFDAKDCPTDKEYFIARWVNPNDWDSIFVLYEREAEGKFFNLFQKYSYTAIAVEYVTSHWGIEAACSGLSNHVSKMKEDLALKGIDYDFLKLDFKKRIHKFVYDLDTHNCEIYTNYVWKNLEIFNYWK